jgi:poly(A) polymerase
MSPSEPLTHTDELHDEDVTVYAAEQHSIQRHDIDDDAQKVVLRLQRSGYKAYVVGGGVRDILLGKQPKDFDISTDATPRDIKSLFRNCRIIGRRFKLAHVFFAHGKNIEVSTFRDSVEWPEQIDVEGANSPVASDNVYGTEATDAVRRDLTINGLFLDVSTMEIIDYVGGMRDLKNGIIRVIGDPDVRFTEDPVRMLRVVRHSARNGFQIESSSWTSILANADKLSQCSQVRVFDELKKDLSSGCFLTILSLLADTGLLDHLLPELLENNSRLLSAESDFSQCLERLDDLVVNEHDVSATVVLALIALFTGGDSIWLGDIAEDLPVGGELAELLGSTFTRLTVPRKERERIQQLIQLWARVRSTPARAFKAGSYKRSSLLPELLTLLEVTGMSQDDRQKLHLLASIADGHGSDEDSGHRRRR